MTHILVHDLIIKNAIVAIKNKKAESNYMAADKFRNFPIVA
jgi:hypothetical protein